MAPNFFDIAPKKRGLHYTPLRSNYLVQFTLCKKKLLLRPHSTVNYGTMDPASVGFQPMVTLQCYQRYVRQAQRRFLKLHLCSFRQNIFCDFWNHFSPFASPPSPKGDAVIAEICLPGAATTCSCGNFYWRLLFLFIDIFILLYGIPELFTWLGTSKLQGTVCQIIIIS